MAALILHLGEKKGCVSLVLSTCLCSKVPGVTPNTLLYLFVWFDQSQTNMDVRAPDCIKRLHEAAIRIVYEHRLEREKVEEILKIIKDAMAGILV